MSISRARPKPELLLANQPVEMCFMAPAEESHPACDACKSKL